VYVSVCVGVCVYTYLCMNVCIFASSHATNTQPQTNPQTLKPNPYSGQYVYFYGLTPQTFNPKLNKLSPKR
jgi:hypothetical protein